jgi:PAS domain S-box-containing protein
MKRPLRLLIVEDNEDDALLFLDELRRGGYEPTFERVEKAAALHDSEARMRLAVVASNIGFWDWNLLADQEIPNRFEEWQSRLHPEDQAPTLAKLRAVLDSAATEYVVEFRLRHRDGSYRWIFTEASITREATGRPLRMVGCHLDLTERKLAEAALLESERKYRLMVDNMAECVLVLDLDLRHVFASPSVVKIYGYTPDEFVALPLERVMSQEAFRQAKQAFAEEMALEASGKADPDRTRPMELLQHRKDGSPIWIESTLSFIRDAAGRPAQILCMAKDITERRQALLALKESRHLLEQAQVFGHIGSWVSEAGPPARLDWSAETFRIFGVAPGQFDGRPESFSRLVHPEDREAVSRAAQAALGGGPAYDLEHRIVRPDGQVRWVHEQADLEHDRSGRAQRMIGVVQDITDRKHMEEQLRQAQKMEVIGQLAGGIAHDFNNIIGAILGNAELMKLLPPGSPEANECLDDILTGSRRAGDLVGQILAFSRRQESKRQPMQLQPVVREVLRLLRATVPANVEFRAQLASVPTVLADPSEIHQVIMNLCTNAWHAMHGQAGLIVVGLTETELAEDFTWLHPDLRPGRYVCLSVTDNGCGMNATTVRRIFEPFFTTKPVGTGTGLG